MSTLLAPVFGPPRLQSGWGIKLVLGVTLLTSPFWGGTNRGGGGKGGWASLCVLQDTRHTTHTPTQLTHWGREAVKLAQGAN